MPLNLFLETVMQETLHVYHISIALRNLRFADDIDIMGGSNAELQYLTNSLVDRERAYGMEISPEKSKAMTNSVNNIGAHISMNSQQFEEVTNFKYLGATLCKDGTCSTQICIGIASAMAVMARFNRIWWSNTISFANKFRFYTSLVTSILLQ